MNRFIAIAIILASVGCSSAQHAQVAHGGVVADARTADAIAQERQPYAEAFADAYQAYESDVREALTLTFSSEAEADAVVQSMTAQRFDGLLDIALARRGVSREALSRYLASDEAFYSELRARYHGRITRLASEVTEVRMLIALDADEPMESDTAEVGRLALSDN